MRRVDRKQARKGNYFLIFSILVIAIIFAGCGARVKPYLSPLYSPLTIKSIAVFPFTSRVAKEEVVRSATNFYESLLKEKKWYSLLGADQTYFLLLERKAIIEYNRLLDEYQATGIINKEMIRKVGEALGVQAILVGEVSHYEHFTFHYSGAGPGLRVGLRLRLLDIKNGVVLWEASSIKEEIGLFSYPAYERVVRRACLSIVKAMSH